MIGTARQQWLVNIVMLIILCVGALIMVAPLAYMAGTAFKPNAYIQEMPPQLIPENPTLDNFKTAFSSRNFSSALRNSFIVAIANSITVTTIASMMGYGFARFTFPGKTILFYAMLMMMMVPSLMLIIPQFILAKNVGLLNSLPGLVVIYTAGGLAFNTFLLRGFFESLPREIEESARIDGANHFTIFWRVMAPLATPAISTVAVFSFLGAWDEYILALTFITDEDKRTLPIAIANFSGVRGTDWGLVFSASLTAVIPTIVLFVFLQRYFVQGLTNGAVRG